MEDETTTPEAVEAGAEQAQPVETTPTEAVETPVVATEEQTEETPAGASDEDAELTDWASKKGLELDSDNTKKAAKMAREAERAMHSKAQKASELEKTVTAASDEQAVINAEKTGQDPEFLKRLQRVEVKEAVRDFWNQDGIDRSFEPAMIEALKTKPYLAGDLESLYAVAVQKSSGGIAAVKSQGGRDALQSLAHKQQAAVPTGSATTKAAPKGKPFAELSLAEMEKQLGYVKR